MRRLFSLILALVLLVSMAACEMNVKQESSDSLLISGVIGSSSNLETTEGSQAILDVSSQSESITYSFSDDELSEATKEAEFLTAHLVFHAIYDFNDGKKTFPDREIENFVLTMFRYLDHPQYFPDREINDIVLATDRYLDNTQYLYHNFFSKTEDGLYLFPVNKVKQLVYEVFGVNDWILDLESSDFRFNEEKQQYESGLQFGFGSKNSYKNMNSEVRKDTATIETSFLLIESASIDGDPGWEEKGYYNFTFQIMHENERIFLRFLEMKSDK